MGNIERIGVIICGIGLAGIIFLVYRGIPLFSLRDIGGFGYYPAVLEYGFFSLVFGVGLVLPVLHREATQGSV